VLEVGEQVSGFQEGDWVVPKASGQGTWRQLARWPSKYWHVVPNTLPLEAAATISVNPVTALRLLAKLKQVQLKGPQRPLHRVIIQNGANSAVGRAIIQLAKVQGIQTVNVVRERKTEAEYVALHDDLKELGGDLVTTVPRLNDDFLRSGLNDPDLAFNCVGGDSAAKIARRLRKFGTLITYGGMAKEPVHFYTSHFIFRSIKAEGFWLSSFDTDAKELFSRTVLIDQVVKHVQAGELKLGGTLVPLARFAEAFAHTHRGKQILQFPTSASP